MSHDLVYELHGLIAELDRLDDLPVAAQDAQLTRIERRLDQITRAYPAPATERGYDAPAPRFREVSAPSSRATYQTPLGARRGGLY